MRSGHTSIVLVLSTAACILPVPAFADGDTAGTQAVLVKSRTPLTPEVLSAIAGHGARVTHAWPEIRALAMSVSRSGLETLAADPHVAFVEADGQGSAEGQGLGGFGATFETPLAAVPFFGSVTPRETWAHRKFKV